MNNYRSKSQLYRVFIQVKVFINTSTVLYYSIFIPKLQISLNFDINSKQYVLPRFGQLNEELLKRLIESSKKAFGHSDWVEINHFKIEHGLVDLLRSKVPEDAIIASEILKTKIEELKLVKQ